MAVKVRKVEIPGAPGKFRRVLSVPAKEFNREGGLLTPEMRKEKVLIRGTKTNLFAWLYNTISKRQSSQRIKRLREKVGKK